MSTIKNVCQINDGEPSSSLGFGRKRVTRKEKKRTNQAFEEYYRDRQRERNTHLCHRYHALGFIWHKTIQGWIRPNDGRTWEVLAQEKKRRYS